MTAFFTSLPNEIHLLINTIEEISSAANCFTSPLGLLLIFGCGGSGVSRPSVGFSKDLESWNDSSNNSVIISTFRSKYFNFVYHDFFGFLALWLPVSKSKLLTITMLHALFGFI
jgi:hypothetical protein